MAKDLEEIVKKKLKRDQKRERLAVTVFKKLVFRQHYQQAEQSAGRSPYHNSVITPIASGYWDKTKDNIRCLVKMCAKLWVCCHSLHITGIRVISFVLTTLRSFSSTGAGR